ncbi:MAG: DUF5667 domain-containing protein [Nocardioidaceae bacterium]
MTARRRADEFAAAVDGRGSSHASQRELLAFVELVEQLRDLETPAMREDFSTDLRARLMAAAPQELAALPTTTRRLRGASTIVPHPPRRRLMSAAAAACIVVGSMAGVAAASQSALPGDPLYPLKRGIEGVQVSVAGSPHGRGHELLDHASTRLSEISDLSVAHSGDPATPALIGQALNDFTDEATSGADELITAYSQDSSDDSIVELRTFAVQSASRLDAMTDVLPANVRDELAAAARALTKLDAQAHNACPTCSALPSLQLSSAVIELVREVGGAGGAVTPGTLPTSPLGTQHPQATPTPQPGPGGNAPSNADTPSVPDLTGPLDPTQGGPTGQAQPTQSADPSVETPGVPDVSVPVDTGVPGLPVPTVKVEVPLPPVPTVLDDPVDLPGLPGLP